MRALNVKLFWPLLAFLVFVATVLAAGPAEANPFTVRNIPVDATAENATQARLKAMAQGQLAAAQRLIDRLTLPETRASLPPITPDIARQLVGGIEVDEENLAGNRYFGTVSVSFRPQQVRGYLASQGIAYLDSPTRPMVLVPVWNGRTLWVDNPMLEEFGRSNAPHALTPVVIPTGDLSDVRAVNLSSLQEPDLTALRSLGDRYGASRALIVRARETANGVSASAQMIDLLDPAGSRGLSPVGGRDIVSVADQLIAQLEQSWKQQTLVTSDVESDLELGVLFSSLAEWLQVQEAVGNASLVRSARLDALAADGALMKIRHRGSFAQLATELNERGVTLVETSDGTLYAHRLGTRPAFLSGSR
jgi:hypothetical protein